MLKLAKDGCEVGSSMKRFLIQLLAIKLIELSILRNERDRLSFRNMIERVSYVTPLNLSKSEECTTDDKQKSYLAQQHHSGIRSMKFWGENYQ